MTAPADDLACLELVELVTDYLEGALTPAERARVDAHLAECDGCTTYVEQMRLTVEAARQVAPGDVPPELVEPLLDAFRAARGGT